MARATGRGAGKSAKEYKGVARQYLKYKGEYFAAGEEFAVEAEDVEELKQYANIEVEETLGNDQENDGVNNQEEGKGEEEGK